MTRVCRAALCSVLSASVGCGLALDGLQQGDASSPDAQAGDDATIDVAVRPDAPSVQDARPDAEPHPDAGATPDGSQVATDANDDGHPPDAGMDSAVTVVSECGDPDSGFLFCDGFEGDLSQWMQAAANGMVAIDTAQHNRGTHSLHAHTDAVSGPQTQINATVSYDGPGSWPNQLYVRFFAYLTTAYPPGLGTLISVQQDTGNPAGLQINTNPPQPTLAGTIYNDPPNDSTWFSTSALTAQSWTCIEVLVDTPNSRFGVWVNDQDVPALDKTFTTLPKMTMFELGLFFYAAPNQGSYDAWIDTVAVRGTYIPCGE